MSAIQHLDAPWDYSRPALRLERLLRRNAVVVQGVFALLWSIRLAVVSGPWEVPAFVGIAFVLSARRAFRATPGLRARDEFRTPKGRAFLRPVTRATLWQILASLVLPVAATAVGLDEWAVPLVALTIGLFLVEFGRHLQLDRVRVIGAMASVASIVLPLVASGDALVAWISVVMTVGLTASMVACARATA